MRCPRLMIITLALSILMTGTVMSAVGQNRPLMVR